jgi:hypothetical protein
MDAAATKVQCAFRTKTAKKTVMDVRKERREAALALRKAQMEAFDVDSSDPYYAAMQQGATKLQSMYRGRAGRKSIAKRRAERMEMNGAATKVQTTFRGKQGRAKAEAKKQAVRAGPHDRSLDLRGTVQNIVQHCQ